MSTLELQHDQELLRRIERTNAARHEALRSLGELEERRWRIAAEVPPYWPGSRCYRQILGNERFILATDGLADPLLDEPGVPGFGVELFAELAGASSSARVFDGAGTSNEEAGWLLALLSRVADEVCVRAGWPDAVARKLQHYGVSSFEFNNLPLPAPWACPAGRVGVLLGIDSKCFDTTFETADGSARLCPVTLLHPSELAAIVCADNGDAMRNQLVDELQESERGHAINPLRPPAACARPFADHAYTHTSPQAPAAPAVEAAPRKAWWRFWS